MRAILVLVLLAGALLHATPAAASCAEPQGGIPEQIAGSEAAFVGTVTKTPGDDRIAHVTVEAVWHGAVAETVEVRGSQMAGDPGAATSVDRHYQTGQRYLFAVSGSGERFEDNACSPTRTWDPELNEHRPEGVPAVAGPPKPVTPPDADPATDDPATDDPATDDPDGGGVSPALMALAFGLCVAAGAGFAWRRGRG
jgi:cell division septation protein DedD